MPPTLITMGSGADASAAGSGADAGAAGAAAASLAAAPGGAAAPMSCRFSRPCSVTSTRANRSSSSICATSSRGVMPGFSANFMPLSDSDCHPSNSSGVVAGAAEAGAVAASVVR